jgi:hypothetical protein
MQVSVQSRVRVAEVAQAKIQKVPSNSAVTGGQLVIGRTWRAGPGSGGIAYGRGKYRVLQRFWDYLFLNYMGD